jgi:hypothetical protein
MAVNKPKGDNARSRTILQTSSWRVSRPISLAEKDLPWMLA